MATTIKEFLVRLGVDGDSKNLKRFASGFEKMRDNARALVGAVAKVGAGVGALGGALVANATETAHFSQQVLEASEAANTTTREFQRLALAGQRFGSDVDESAELLRILSDRADDVKRGTASFAESFRLIGISADEVRGKNPRELLDVVADGIANTEDRVDKLTAAERILGGDMAKKFLPLLNKGSDGIEALGDEFEKTAGLMSRDALEASRQFGNEWDTLTATGTQLRRMLAAEMAPAMSNIVENLQDWIKNNRDLIDQKIDALAQNLIDLFRGIGDAIQEADDIAQSLGGWEPVLKSIAGISGTLMAIWAGSKIVGTINGAITAGSALVDTLGSVAAKSAAANTSGTLMGSSVKSALGGIGSAASSLIGTAGPLAVIGVTLHDIWALGAGEDTITGSILDWLEGFDNLEGAVKSFRSSWDHMTTEIANAMAASVETITDLWRGLQNTLSGTGVRERVEQGLEGATGNEIRVAVQRAQKLGLSAEQAVQFAPEGQRERVRDAIRAGQSRSARQQAGRGGGDTVINSSPTIDVTAPAEGDGGFFDLETTIQEQLRDHEDRMMRKARDSRVKGGAQ